MGEINLERRNIFLIVIIIVLIIGIGIGVTLYEQQQVKKHLTIANNYHTILMGHNPEIANATLKKVAAIDVAEQPDLANELTELREANTIFATSNQKSYILAAITVNTDNTKINNLQINANKTTNLDQLEQYVTSIDQIYKDRTTATQTRDSLIATYPEEFGFNVTTI
jgi:predicted negative regulator of RcsB-dependent stress response